MIDKEQANSLIGKTINRVEGLGSESFGCGSFTIYFTDETSIEFEAYTDFHPTDPTVANFPRLGIYL